MQQYVKMPNWCNNAFHIHGTQEEINHFLSKWTNKKCIDGEWTSKRCLKFNDFVTIPKEEEENWYDWNVNNWGTKWDLVEDMTTVITLDTEIQVETQTAWAPPLKFFETLSKMYPTMTFTVSYHEEGMMFCGYAEWSGGEEVTNLHIAYESRRQLKQFFEEYSGQYTEAWWPPSESELEEEEEDEQDEEVKAAESRSQEG